MPVVEKIKSMLHGHDHHEHNTTHHTTTHHVSTVGHGHGPVVREEKTVVVEKPLLAQERVEKHVVVEKPVLAEKTVVVEKPLLAEKNVIVQKEVLNEKTVVDVAAAPVNVEHIEKEVVVHEHIHPIEKEEIQQIVHREREQLEVRQVTQKLHETEIAPTIVQQRELAAEVREVVVEKAAPIQENIQIATVDVDTTRRTEVVHAPIVQELIKKTVIEEVQPVLEKDVIVPTLVQNTQHVYEKIVEAPVVVREELVVKELGTRGVMDARMTSTTVVEERKIVDSGVKVYETERVGSTKMYETERIGQKATVVEPVVITHRQ